MPWVAIPVLAAVLVLAVVFAVRYSAAREEESQRAWRQFATSRGLRFVESSGPWYRRTPNAIQGSVEGVELVLDTYVVSTGKSHVTFTRVRGWLGHPFAEKITVRRRNFFTGIGEKLGRVSVRTNNRAFDERRVVRTKAKETALRVLDEDVRSRILSFARPADLQIAGNEIKLWWRGTEVDTAVLESASTLVAALGRACAKS